MVTHETDQAIFIRDINNAISSEGKEVKRNVEHIMKDLETYCNNIKCLKFAVFFTETSTECDVSRGDTQDSLMRMLLQVNCLQTPVTELLMDKLAKIVMDGTGEDDDTPVLSWVRMILQCFRFLNSVLDGSSVNERLLDVVLATSDVTIQQEVVISLPDIISDAEHHHAALELSKLIRKSNPQLMASALEALTNLSLQPEVRAQVQPVLMKALHKVQPEFLPAILKFLFADNDPPLLDEIISYIRNELDLAEIEGDVASIQVLVFSTLRDALLSSRTLPNIWQKNISSVKSQVEHKPIDVIMLLILLSTTNDPVRQKSVEGVFRNRIRSDLFTEALINETLKNYIAVIKEYFQVATKLAGALLRSTEPAVVEFASKMYIGMFENTEGLWCKWVLSDLQVCVGAGDANVARAALNVLQHLTNQHHNKVKPLGVILMLLLNKLSDLALSEVCQLMDILCHIAYSEDDISLSDCSILQEEINILVQKQLASSQLNILRSGVVGCVMTIKHIASIPQPENSEMSDTNNEEISEKAKRAVQLLEMLLSSTRKCVEAHGLALDQLSHLLISGTTTGTMLDPSFIKNLSSLMRDSLQDVFLISYSDFDSKSFKLFTHLLHSPYLSECSIHMKHKLNPFNADVRRERSSLFIREMPTCAASARH
ncbi:Fanconi anemia group D2 protein [Homalodisca vitripennis]|nr:Fanconi anemia group D2 protein [Homalodisca vitripennis]